MSMSNNIAEVNGLNSTKEFYHFLNIARRSAFVNVNILILLRNLNPIIDDKLQKLLD